MANSTMTSITSYADDYKDQAKKILDDAQNLYEYMSQIIIIIKCCFKNSLVLKTE